MKHTNMPREYAPCPNKYRSVRGVEYTTLARTEKQYRDIIVQFSPDQNSITGTVLIGGESSIVNKMVLPNTITLRKCDRGDSGILT